MIPGIPSALLQPANISLDWKASIMISGATKNTAALQEAGRCIQVLAYIARKGSEGTGHQALPLCRLKV